LGYYTNFILLAAFVGIGGGMLLAKKYGSLDRFFPWCLLIIVAICTIFSISVYPDSAGEIHFFSNFKGFVLPEIFVVPFIFIFSSAIFALFAGRLSALFDSLAPLSAYTYDILGSLAGIVAFTSLSLFRATPFVWFISLAVIYGSIIFKEKYFYWSVAVLLAVAAITIPVSRNSVWSPYQKISVVDEQSSGEQRYRLLVNNISHQTIESGMKEWFYRFHYFAFNKNHFNRALIIGSGSGNDVAIALKNNVDIIDAVEIDPEIVSAGKKYHPDQPYSDPRVNLYIGDGRTFLKNTDNKYDLIIFALPDSLVLAATHGNIRLESFLFTEEAFSDARSKLNDNGIFVLYNYYRAPWLISKIALMMENIFGYPPYVISLDNGVRPAVIMAGGRLSDLKDGLGPSQQIPRDVTPSTDDWPFLYLARPSLPVIYIWMIVFVLVSAYVMFSYLNGGKLYKNIVPSYFFLGMAFMLLEAKAIVQFMLLFGPTWIVNALVFFAILLSVLLAIKCAEYFKLNNIRLLYLLLAVSLVAQYVFPYESLLSASAIIRYIFVSVITFAPIFFANIIFARLFRDSKNNSINFASNILGAAVGGIAEYFSMITGYHHLSLIIIGLYFLAFLFQHRDTFFKKAPF
jgi:spermidine synthase